MNHQTCILTLLAASLLGMESFAATTNGTPAAGSPGPAASKAALEIKPGENRAEDPKALARELLNDTGRPAVERAAAAARLAESYRKDGDLEKAIAVGEEALGLPLDAEQKAAIQLRNAGYFQSMKPPKREEADALCKAVMGDPSVPMKHRVSAYVSLTQAILAGKNPAEKKRVPELARDLLAGQGLSGEESFRIQSQIIKAAQDLNDGDALMAAASAVLANTNSTNAQKIQATWFMVDHDMNNGRIAEAEKRVREPLAYAGLSEDDRVAAVANIGRTLEWQEKCDEAIAAYTEVLKTGGSAKTTNRVNQLIADALVYFGRFEEAAAVFNRAGKPLDEARIYSLSETPEKGKAIALAVLQDDKQPAALRRQAYSYFIGPSKEDRAIADQYLAFYLDQNRADAFAQPARVAMMKGDYEYALRCLEILRSTPAYRDDFLMVTYTVNALGGLGKTAEGGRLAAEYAGKAAFKPAQRYQLALTAALLQVPENGDMARALQGVDAASPDFRSLDAKSRSDAILKAARSAMIANRKGPAEAAYAAYESLFIPEPKKEYAVPFSETPISGITSWEALRVQPAKALMDRAFGGNLDFLVTDVATGERSAGIGTEAASPKRRPGELAVACDVNGLHFLFTTYDDRAREVEAKLLGGGNYESYLSAGPNQPEICFLTDLQSGRLTFWHSTYNNDQHRRMEAGQPGVRSEHVFSDTGYKTYVFLAWTYFYDKFPDAGNAWDFENIHWGRSGGMSWNGTKSIHGRSTWGRLRFSIPAKNMIDIKRKLVFNSLAAYQAEKVTGHGHQGVIDFWKDPAIGDPVFYKESVSPLVERLDSYIPKVKADMSDVDVDLVFREAVPGWNEIRFTIADRRRQYLEVRLSE